MRTFLVLAIAASTCVGCVAAKYSPDPITRQARLDAYDAERAKIEYDSSKNMLSEIKTWDMNKPETLESSSDRMRKAQEEQDKKIAALNDKYR